MRLHSKVVPQRHLAYIEWNCSVLYAWEKLTLDKRIFYHTKVNRNVFRLGWGKMSNGASKSSRSWLLCTFRTNIDTMKWRIYTMSTDDIGCYMYSLGIIYRISVPVVNIWEATSPTATISLFNEPNIKVKEYIELFHSIPNIHVWKPLNRPER